MVDWVAVGWLLVAGAAMGLFYFGGLWLTVNQLTTTNRPGLLFLVSFLVRTAVVLGAVYLVMGSQWERAAVVVLGFLLARLVMVHYFGIAPQGR
jgi:F1F0 ATPase subunit 2